MAEKPWLAHYDPGVPAAIDVPEIALPDLLAQAARDFPDAPAIQFYGHTIDYAELNRLATSCGAALVASGVRPGERVMLVLPNVPQAVICYYGALRAGALVVLSNPIVDAGSLSRQVDDAGAATIIALTMFHPLVIATRFHAAFERVIYTNIKEHLPPSQRLLFNVLRQSAEGHRVPEQEAERSLWLARMLAAADPATPLPALAPDAPAVVLYTGGTTGEPKGVVHSHRSLVANALQTLAWMPRAERGRERVLGALPLSHAYGMTACMNLAVACAAAMILLPGIETQHLLHAARRDRPTIFPGVPPMYGAIADVRGARRYGLAELKACISGAAPLPIEIQEGFERVTKARLIEGYGLTEAGPVTHANPLAGPRRHGSIGVPLPSTEAMIVDLRTGAELPPGKIGELLVRGPQLMLGYWNRPAETAEVLGGDGWLRTGDLARMQPDGFFQIIERRKEMIVAGPYNVYPRDIEEVLYEYPGVVEAAVAGVPRGDATEIRAFVVLREGERVTVDEILDFLRERVKAYQLPQAVEFLPKLPRSFIGKVLRRELVEQARAAAED